MKYALETFSKLKYVFLTSRALCSKVPVQPIHVKKELDEVKVDKNTIALLERLSLVKTDPEEGVKILEDSISFANQVLHIDTDNVKPLYSVLEERHLSLRSDNITQGNCQKDILKNATVKEDDYFIAPLGNIPLHVVEVDKKTTERKSKENEIQCAKHNK